MESDFSDPKIGVRVLCICRMAKNLRVDREKISEYLLNLAHPDGGGKAVFFLRFGFRIENWEEFANNLRRQGATHPIARTVESP